MSAVASAEKVSKKQVLQKHWSVTMNGPELLKHYAGTADSDFEILLVGPPADVCKHQAAWWIGQLEKAPSTGVLHLQMHVAFKSKVGFNGVKHFFDQSNFDGAHFEPVKDLDSHLAYVVKDESRVMGPYRSPGAPKPGGAVKGKRSDLEGAVNALKNGASIEKLWKEHSVTMVNNYRGLTQLALRTDPTPTRPDMHTICIYGKPRMGKSTLVAYLCKELSPDEEPFTKPIGKWFCGYTGQPVVVMEDFDSKGQACREIKNICDKTPCIVETKGGQVSLKNRVVVITANRDPRTWFPGEDAIDLAAVLERMLFFRVEEHLVENAGRRDGSFGLNAVGRSLLALIHRVVDTESKLGEGKAGYRGEAGLRAQDTVYGRYGDQIMALPRVVPAVVDVSDSSDDDMAGAGVKRPRLE